MLQFQTVHMYLFIFGREGKGLSLRRIWTNAILEDLRQLSILYLSLIAGIVSSSVLHSKIYTNAGYETLDDEQLTFPSGRRPVI